MHDALTLSTALATRPHTKSLKTKEIVPAGIDLDFVEVKPIIAAFRRMIRSLEFDICELAPTTYLAARAAGLPITALPIFLTRRFHHGDIVCRTGSGIEKPRDLEGRRVGVRAYTVSTGVWARGILRDEYGVDLDAVTWVVDDEEHVAELTLPPNVEHVPAGDSIAAQFHAGTIDAALSGPAGIGRTGAPTESWGIAGSGFEDARRASEIFYPLFPDAGELEAESYRRTHIYPIHGLVAIKTEIVEAHPEVVASLTDAFVAAKQPFLAELAAGDLSTQDHQRLAPFMSIVGPDPLPYGVEANLPTLEAMCAYAVDQHIVDSVPAVDDLFVTA